MTSVNEEKKNGSKKGTIVKFIIVAFLSMAVGAVGAIFIYREIGKDCKKKNPMSGSTPYIRLFSR